MTLEEEVAPRVVARIFMTVFLLAWFLVWVLGGLATLLFGSGSP